MRKEEFPITCYMCDTYTWQRWSLFIRDKPILSSEKMLHKDYDSMGSAVEKKTDRKPQETWYQDELIGSNSPVVK
jgi:hypothetical protein